jgi:hypothetical protein
MDTCSLYIYIYLFKRQIKILIDINFFTAHEKMSHKCVNKYIFANITFFHKWIIVEHMKLYIAKFIPFKVCEYIFTI